MRLASARILLAVFALTLAACSSYEKRWQSAKVTAAKDSYSGAWTGIWTSEKHHNVSGRLRCVLTPTDQPGDYLAEFEATWLKVFYSTHQVVLHSTPGPRIKNPAADNRAEPSRHFQGSAQLNTSVGAGTYRCEGTLTPKSFHAHYDATYDIGTFSLPRPM